MELHELIMDRSRPPAAVTDGKLDRDFVASLNHLRRNIAPKTNVLLAICKLKSLTQGTLAWRFPH